MDRCASVNRAVLMAFCGLLAATPVYADSEHKAKPAASREDREAVLRHTMRDPPVRVPAFVRPRPFGSPAPVTGAGSGGDCRTAPR